MLLHQFLEQTARRMPDQVALVCQGASYTYRQIDEAAARLGAAMQHRGVRRNCEKILRESVMNLTLSIGPLVSLIAGILILIVPRLLNYIVAIYLIIIGLLGLFGAGNYHFK